MDFRHMQARLGVQVDGIIGRGTWQALLLKVGARQAIAEELGLAAGRHAHNAAIDASPLRLAHFVAQLGHESDGFRAMEEYADGSAYEGRKDLGNVNAGDGKRYKGRGPIQLTGRANYRDYGRRLGLDLERHPEIVAYPSVGMLVACTYWQVHGLNDLADADALEAVTKRINGGTRGLDDRRRRLGEVKALLA